MKCRRCRRPAVIDVRRHNAAFCAPCFRHHCTEQVRRAIDQYDMIRAGDRCLVAVSGGKDSLMVWDVLRELGHQADGLYVGLGIDEYSETSGRHARAYAEERGFTLHEVDLRERYGYDVPGGSRAARRTPCSACGLSKRHVFNEVALEHGYDVLVTGHNLDDEAAVLYGNVMRWDEGSLARQYPMLPASPGFARKVKPLVRLGERETAAYCVLAGIDYMVEECPMAAGNRHLGYKELLNQMEARSPGSKAAFLFGFLDRARPRFAGEIERERDDLEPCERCGAPTPSGVCAFCRLRERATGDGGGLVPVAAPRTATG